MPKSTLETQILARIDAFASELTGLVRQAALESVQNALGGSSAAGAAKGGNGRRRGRRRGRKPGPRPSSKSIGDASAKILAHVRSNPGQSISEIATALRSSSGKLRPAMQDLLKQKSLRTTGQRRGTKYHLAGGGAGGGTKRKGRPVGRPRGKKRGRKGKGARKAARAASAA